MSEFDKEYRRAAHHKSDHSTVVEYWVPPEKSQHAKRSTTPHMRPAVVAQTAAGSTPITMAKRVAKVREPRGGGENSSKKSSADHPPSGIKVMVWNMGKYFAKISERFGAQIQRVKMVRNRMKANKVAPIHTKIQSRHLELEPLCCLSSCLVRGGCSTVVVFEILYIIATLLVTLEAMVRKDFILWENIPTQFNLLFSHQLFHYAILFYDLILLLFAVSTARALINFDKRILRAHYFFCFFSILINLCFLLFSIWTLSSPGPLTFTPLNSFLIFCFFSQIPLQIWASSVVRSCRDFFALIHVFVSLAES